MNRILSSLIAFTIPLAIVLAPTANAQTVAPKRMTSKRLTSKRLNSKRLNSKRLNSKRLNSKPVNSKPVNSNPAAKDRRSPGAEPMKSTRIRATGIRKNKNTRKLTSRSINGSSAKARGRLPRFYGQLELNGDQRSKVYEIQQKFASQREDLLKQVETLQTSKDRKLGRVLKPAQRQKLQKLVAQVAASRGRARTGVTTKVTSTQKRKRSSRNKKAKK